MCSWMFLLTTCSLWHATQRCSTTCLTSPKLGTPEAAAADGSGRSATTTAASSAQPVTAYSHGTRRPSTCARWRATNEWRISSPAAISSTSTAALCEAPYRKA